MTARLLRPRKTPRGPMTLREVRRLGCSPTQVQRIERRALAKLRAALEDR